MQKRNPPPQSLNEPCPLTLSLSPSVVCCWHHQSVHLRCFARLHHVLSSLTRSLSHTLQSPPKLSEGFTHAHTHALDSHHRHRFHLVQLWAPLSSSLLISGPRSHSHSSSIQIRSGSCHTRTLTIHTYHTTTLTYGCAINISSNNQHGNVVTYPDKDVENSCYDVQITRHYEDNNVPYYTINSVAFAIHSSEVSGQGCFG